MAVVGFQDFWVTGSRFYFQREPVSSVVQPFVDLGVIQVASPTLEITKIELKDSDGGVKRVVDQKVTEINETYDITCSNLNGDNLSLLFLSAAPEAFSQSATQVESSPVYSHPGRLVKLLDANGIPIFGITSVEAVTKATNYALVSITSSTKTIVVTGDCSSVMTVGVKIAVVGSVQPTDDGIYTVASSSYGAPNTSIIVTETVAVDATAGGTVSEAYILDTDWEVVSLERGIIRMIDGGAFATAANIDITFTPRAISGARLIKPQSSRGEIKGKGWVIWGRENNASQSMREADVSITPSSGKLDIEDYSNFVLQAKVLSDVTLVQPAGRLLNWLGDLPTKS